MDNTLSRIVGFTLSLANAIGQAPYKWDPKAQKIVYANSPQWKLNICLTTPHTVFILFRFLASVNRSGPLFLILQVIYVLSLTIAYSYHLTMLVAEKTIMHSLNGIFGSFKLCGGKYTQTGNK